MARKNRRKKTGIGTILIFIILIAAVFSRFGGGKRDNQNATDNNKRLSITHEASPTINSLSASLNANASLFSTTESNSRLTPVPSPQSRITADLSQGNKTAFSNTTGEEIATQANPTSEITISNFATEQPTSIIKQETAEPTTKPETRVIIAASETEKPRSEYPFIGYITYDGLTVRKEPSKSAEALLKLAVDSTVSIIDKVEGDARYWYRIQCQSGNQFIDGYVLYDYVERSTTLKVYNASLSPYDAIAGVNIPATEVQASAPSSGTATLLFEGIGAYSGNFDAGKRSGKGTFIWLNGDTYEGEWKNDLITGQGQLTFADGIIYEGTFSKGKLTKGTITIPQGDGRIALRSVRDGELQQACTLIWPDGTRLEGRTGKNGFSGEVTIAYVNGDSYVGTLKEGLKSGSGTYTWRNGAFYKGSWENDKMNGNGTYYFTSSTKGNYIKGIFSNNQPSGTMTYYADNGLKYDTKWSNGKCIDISYKK